MEQVYLQKSVINSEKDVSYPKVKSSPLANSSMHKIIYQNILVTFNPGILKTIKSFFITFFIISNCVLAQTNNSILNTNNIENNSYINHVMTKEQLGADLLAVAYGNGVFVAVGDSVLVGKVFKSNDGITWTQGNGFTYVDFEGIKFINGYFYSFGRWRKVNETNMPYYSTIWRSADGLNWEVAWSQIVDGNPQYGVQDIAYGNEKFVVAINDRLFVSSNNLSSLTQTTAINGTGLQDQFGLRKLSYGNGMFVAANDMERSWAVNMAYSTDGTNWTTNNNEPNADCVAFINNHFAALSGARIRISNNGIEWTEVPQGKGTSIAYANGTYIIPNAIGGHPNTDMRYSTDLNKNISKMYQRNLGFSEWSDLRDVAVGSNGFVIVGGAGILYTSFSDSQNYPKILGSDIIELEKGKAFEYSIQTSGFNPDFVRTNLEQHLGVTLPPGINQKSFSYGVSINEKAPHFTGTPTQDGEWPVILYVYEDGLGEQDLYVKKKVTFKVTTTTNVQEEIILPSEFELTQNYPNPFNPSTKINYQIPTATNVKIIVFDFLGREIATLVDEYKQPGVYSAEFRIQDAELSSGIYFYTLQAGDLKISKKMLLLK